MADFQRYEEPERYYLLTNRTEQGRFLFRPDAECRRIAKGCLAWAAEKCGVRLVAYVFISNHFHIVAAFPDASRGEFMREFQGELSGRIGDHREDYDGTVFNDSYHPLPLLDPETLLERISYTVNNAVRHGLVTHPEAWPGVCSFENLRDGTPLVGHWLDHNRWHNLSRRKEPPPRKAAMVEHVIDLHIPECLPGETEQERRRLMLDKIEEERKRFCFEAGIDRHCRPDSPSEFKTMDWRTKQRLEDESKPRKACAAKDPSRVADYLEMRRETDADYRAAAEAWKAGEPATFPLGTYPPGCAKLVEELKARAPPE